MSFFSRETIVSVFLLASFTTPTWAGCQAGYYCAKSVCPSNSHCTACPGGQYYPTYRSTSSSCTECDEGYYCPSGSTAMTTCPAGYYCPIESASYTACSPGQYCEAGSSEESACPSGTYSSSAANSCSECPSDQPYSCTGADMCDENPCDRYFEIYEGDCTTSDDGTCIYSPNYPSAYEHSSSCSINVNKDAFLNVEDFWTESGYDYLTVNDVEYSGTSGPQDIVVSAGDFIYFYSDSSFSYSGFAICAITTTSNGYDDNAAAYDDDDGDDGASTESDFPVYIIFIAALPFVCFIGSSGIKSYIKNQTSTHSIQQVLPEQFSTASNQASQGQLTLATPPLQAQLSPPIVAFNQAVAEPATFVVSVVSSNQAQDYTTRNVSSPIVAYVVE